MREALEAVIVIAVLLSLVEAIVSTTSAAEITTNIHTPDEKEKTPEQGSPNASDHDGREESSPPDRTLLVKKLRIQESTSSPTPGRMSSLTLHSPFRFLPVQVAGFWSHLPCTYLLSPLDNGILILTSEELHSLPWYGQPVTLPVICISCPFIVVYSGSGPIRRQRGNLGGHFQSHRVSLALALLGSMLTECAVQFLFLAWD